jgi:hypothetical protein
VRRDTKKIIPFGLRDGEALDQVKAKNILAPKLGTRQVRLFW